MTHDDLIDKMRDAAIEAARRSGERRRPKLSRLDFAPALDLVVDEVLAIVRPHVENEWGGDALLRRLQELRSNHGKGGSR